VIRDASSDLDVWLRSAKRKPLVLRGARQVGKSYLVRDFAKQHSLDLIELNFERDPSAAKLFAASDVATTLRAIEAFARKRIVIGKTLLFLDEIQAAPDVLAQLRWLHEERPRLAVIGAGSLLDFALAEHTFSMPVGRISYLYLEPMSFSEFLRGIGDNELADVVTELSLSTLAPLHTRLLERFREYLLVGGMPEAVDTYRESRSLLECARVHHDLLATLRDDFAKYASRVQRERLIKVLDAVPRLVGRKFVYSQVDRDERAASLRQAVDLLCMARVCHRVQMTHATGIPLSAEVDERRYKLVLLDVGLLSAALGLDVSSLAPNDDLVLANGGALAEQAVGQALRVAVPRFQDPALFYWTRDAQGSEAEVDYVVQHGKGIVPIEVKAGATGSLRSLHALVAARKWKRAIRFNSNVPSTVEIGYQLRSLPIYLAEQVHRLLDDR